MPRKARRTQSGAPAQPARPPVNVPYGEGERRIEAQRRTPLPDASKARQQLLSGATGGGAAGTTAAPASHGGNLQDAMAMMAAMEPGTPLDAPTGRPSEHVMTGAPTPRTPIPEPDPALYELRALAKRYPYPDLLRLIEMAERSL